MAVRQLDIGSLPLDSPQDTRLWRSRHYPTKSADKRLGGLWMWRFASPPPREPRSIPPPEGARIAGIPSRRPHHRRWIKPLRDGRLLQPVLAGQDLRRRIIPCARQDMREPPAHRVELLVQPAGPAARDPKRKPDCAPCSAVRSLVQTMNSSSLRRRNVMARNTVQFHKRAQRGCVRAPLRYGGTVPSGGCRLALAGWVHLPRLWRAPA